MSSSRMEAVVLSLREQILSGELGQGSKITETGMADRLGVSRTPVRLALQVLESEGLVVGELNRGFTVRQFSEADVLSGFDVRGALEGLACRLIAEAGMRRAVEGALTECVARGDLVCERRELDEVTVRSWTEVNREFHHIIISATENPVLSATYEQVCRNPLVGPTSLAFYASHLVEDTITIERSQQQHRAIFSAMRDGQGTRAEYLAREHIQTARESTAHQLRRRILGADAKGMTG